MWYNNFAMRQISISFNEEEISALQHIANEKKRSVSFITRMMVLKGIGNNKLKEKQNERVQRNIEYRPTRRR